MQVIKVDESNRQAYADYVASHPLARFGHDLEWADVLRKTYGVGIEHFMIFEHGRVAGVCPLFLGRPLTGGRHYQTSLFPSYFGPLFDDVKVYEVMMNYIKDTARDADFAEVLSPFALPEDHSGRVFKEEIDLTFRLNLKRGLNEIFGDFCRDYKRIIRKAYDPQEMQIVVDQTGEHLNDFYKLYVEIYAGKHGFVPHVRTLFRNFVERFPVGAARIYLCKVGGRFTGGMFTIWMHNEVYYAWSAVRADHIRHPAHFLIWQIVQDAAAQGYAWFNMGEAPVNHSGLIRFKREWGAEIVSPVRYFVAGRVAHPTPRLFDRAAWIKDIISRLPGGFVSTFISPAIRFFL